MLLYRCDEDSNTLYFKENDQEWKISFPTPLPNQVSVRVQITQDKQYLLIEIPFKMWVYDRKTGQLMAVPHKEKKGDMAGDMCFDGADNLYYSDGNTFWRWRLGDRQPEKLVRYQSVKMGFDKNGVSPGGRYLSYLRYRADNYWLHLYDIQTGEIHDLKSSIYRYDWMDATHIAWTKGGGLVVLDTETGKKKNILSSFKSVLKRYKGEEVARLQPFLECSASEKKGSVLEKIDLIGIQNGRLWFTLVLTYYAPRKDLFCTVDPNTKILKIHAPHEEEERKGDFYYSGIWSVDMTGKDIQFHYSISEKGFGLFLSQAKLLPHGMVTWQGKSGKRYIYNGTECQTIEGWEIAFSVK